MSSPCALNRSITFLQSWQNGQRQRVKMRYGDHGPSAPKATPISMPTRNLVLLQY